MRNNLQNPTSGKIGIFDSGVGGLTTLVALRETFPLYDYMYLGDVARAPYGSKNQDELYTFLREAVAYLRAQGCSLVIVACNTASTHALRRLQDEHAHEWATFRILGILTPVVEKALRTTRNKRIGVIATEATVTSNKYEREIHKTTHDMSVYQQAAPTLATCIETQAARGELRAAVEAAIAPLLAHNIDTLVLGCTHYAHIADLIREVLPAHIALVHEGQCIAGALRDYLARHAGFAATLSTGATVVVETTKMTDTFTSFVRQSLPGITVQETAVVPSPGIEPGSSR